MSKAIEDAYRLAVSIDERGDGSILNDELISMLGDEISLERREQINLEVEKEYNVVRDPTHNCKRCGSKTHDTNGCLIAAPGLFGPIERDGIYNEKRMLAIIFVVIAATVIIGYAVLYAGRNSDSAPAAVYPAPDPESYPDGLR
jgi:hypothetical protein